MPRTDPRITITLELSRIHNLIFVPHREAWISQLWESRGRYAITASRVIFLGAIILWRGFLKINISCLCTCDCELYLGDGEPRCGGQVAAWKRTLCAGRTAGYGAQMSHAEIHCVPSYNFIEADLRSIVRPVDSRRGVVCVHCARAHVCGGSVRASSPVRSYLQMALGTCSLAQRSRKLGNDVSDRVLFSFITMHKGITQPYLGSALLTSFCYAYRYV